ncbi:DnaB-like helicase C-terminal domain-containing protein [Bacteroidota bacterium]
MDKLKLKREFELQILGYMIGNPRSIPFFLQRLELDHFGKELKSVLKIITDTYNQDFNITTENLILSIKGYTPDDVMQEILSNQSYDTRKSYQDILVKKFVDLYISVETDRIFRTRLNDNRERVDGLDWLNELNEELNQLFSITERFRETKSYSENIIEFLQKIESEATLDISNSLKMKNYPSFNSACGGLRAPNLIAIAGAWKNGKTTFGLALLLDLIEQGIPCGLFSLELGEDEIYRKIIAMQTGINYDRLRDPQKLTSEDKLNLSKYCADVRDKNIPLYIETKNVTELQLKSITKQWIDQKNIKIILIDYIGYLRTALKSKSLEQREREITHYSTFLKQMSKDLDIPIIILAQLNRDGINHPDSSRLAESIGLARDCDFLFIITKGPRTLKDDNSGEERQIKANQFLIKLDSSRHTESGKQFILQLNDDGTLVENSTQYDYSYEDTKHDKFLNQINKQLEIG